MLFPDPQNKSEEKMNDIQFKIIMILGIATIVFGIIMYPIVMR